MDDALNNGLFIRCKIRGKGVVKLGLLLLQFYKATISYTSLPKARGLSLLSSALRKSWYGSTLSRGVSRRLSSPNSSSESFSRFPNFWAYEREHSIWLNTIITYLFIKELQISTALIFAITFIVHFLFFCPCRFIAGPLSFFILIVVIVG